MKKIETFLLILLISTTQIYTQCILIKEITSPNQQDYGEFGSSLAILGDINADGYDVPDYHFYSR